MESIKLLDIIYQHGSHDSVDGMYRKAHEILQAILMGETPREEEYHYIGVRLASAMMKYIDKDLIQRYLDSRAEYKIDQRPETKRTWRWSNVQDRYVKWQMDLLDIRKFDLGPAYLLSVIDTFSKFGFLFPLTSKRGEEVSFYLYTLFSRKGPEWRPLGIIERLGQTIKRKIRKAISKGTLNQDNFPTRLLSMLRDYNEAIHSTIKQRPVVVHFTHNRFKKQIIKSVRQRLQAIRKKQMEKARMASIPLQVEQRVRVLVWKDPRLSRGDQYKVRKQFNFNKFAMSYWTRDVFQIESVQDHNYKLKGYPQHWYVREDLQRVSKFL